LSSNDDVNRGTEAEADNEAEVEVETEGGREQAARTTSSRTVSIEIVWPLPRGLPAVIEDGKPRGPV